MNYFSMKPLPTESEVMAELEAFLIDVGRAITPSEAYRELVIRFWLTAEQRTRLMSNKKDDHWENRIRFARRKLMDAGRLDADQPRWLWRIRTSED